MGAVDDEVDDARQAVHVVAQGDLVADAPVQLPDQGVDHGRQRDRIGVDVQDAGGTFGGDRREPWLADALQDEPDDGLQRLIVAAAQRRSKRVPRAEFIEDAVGPNVTNGGRWATRGTIVTWRQGQGWKWTGRTSARR